MQDDEVNDTAKNASGQIQATSRFSDVQTKNFYMSAKAGWDASDEASRVYYSAWMSDLPGLIQRSQLTEAEMGVAPAVAAGEFPYQPTAGVETKSATVSVVGNSGRLKIPNMAEDFYHMDWVFVGLYAPPGRMVQLTVPSAAVGKMEIILGPHNDKLYRLVGEKRLRRDPEISTKLTIITESLTLGTPYGGLIAIRFTDSSLDGEILELRFENVMEAPHFVLGEHTDADWILMKSLPAPWTVFEILRSITFVVPTSKVEHYTEIEAALGDWRAFMEKNDFASGLVDRKVGELIVYDAQSAYGYAHSQYPVVIGDLGPVSTTLFAVHPFTADHTVAHEVGHNMAGRTAGWYLSHTSVNLAWAYGNPHARQEKHGTWGRESRVLDYVKAGKVRDEDTWWNYDVFRMPMDGLDGNGWQHDGTWEDFPKIIAEYNKIPRSERKKLRADQDVHLSFWVQQVCAAKKMNMIQYFQFVDFPILTEAAEECSKYPAKPTEIMAWLTGIESIAEESITSGCDEAGGFFGHNEKCFKMSRERLLYEEAQSFCQGLNGQLANVENKKDVLMVQEAFYHYINQVSRATKTLWIAGVSDGASLYPHGQSYELQPGEHPTLTIDHDIGSACHLSKLKCLMPSKLKDKSWQYKAYAKALCEIPHN